MKTMLFILLTVAGTVAMADNYVAPHVRKDGTFVEGHFRSGADRNPHNNYSTQGNSNPYTGQQGSRDPYQAQQQYAPPKPVQPNYGNAYEQPRRSW